jgi:hypothetical protein
MKQVRKCGLFDNLIAVNNFRTTEKRPVLSHTYSRHLESRMDQESKKDHERFMFINVAF